MTLLNEQYGVFYAAVPKVACTSLKHFIYTAMTGEVFDPEKEGKFIHDVFPTLLRPRYPDRAASMPLRIAVVRNPLDRVVSAYRNRVRALGALSGERVHVALRLEKLGLKPDPELDVFIENVELYQQANPSILHHTRPIVDFLGSDAEFFTRIYGMHELQSLAESLNARFGTTVQLQRRQASGDKISAGDLSDRHRQKMLAYYAQDIAVFGKYW